MGAVSATFAVLLLVGVSALGAAILVLLGLVLFGPVPAPVRVRDRRS